VTERFHSGERELQDRFDSRRLADRVGNIMHDTFTEGDIDFLGRMDMFFLATGDAEGNLDCSYKGGAPGFIRVLDERTLAYPSYDGNGMFMSTGNVLQHPKVGMLFVDFDRQRRMRVNGTASIHYDHPLMKEYAEAQFVVEVRADTVFSNCPRYIHKMALVERSAFVPKSECDTPDPEWKDHFEQELPVTQQERRAATRSEKAR
jgi:predicted pyridoxine 5'-phosphate oxidase superfamily flavin-nucleotide-binding protein